MKFGTSRAPRTFALFILAASASPAWAVIEITDVRAPLPGQGYLQYKVNPASSRFGEELTGWIDVRHPVLDGMGNVFEPYDRSNHFINTHSIVMKDSAGVSAAPDLARDWDRSSKIYAQAGISTPRISGTTPQMGNTWANFDGAQRVAFANAGTGRAAGASTLNMYYAKSFSDAEANGLTRGPEQVNGTTILQPYSYVRDGSVDSTMPHEAGHQLLNGNALHMETPGTPSESDDTKNWMFKTGSSYNINEINRDKGRIEGVQIDRLYANGGANNPGFVQRSLNHENYGNRVDFHYVQDDYTLEARGLTADDHPGSTESLFFAPGTTTSIAAEAHHDLTGLPTFANVPDYAGAFRVADVFSMSTRYSDFDRFSPTGDFSRRNGALDYTVVFLDAQNNLVPGVLDTVFAFGWSVQTLAEDYLGRWTSPVDAVGMFVFPLTANGTFDGNTQIDAVIVAAAIPEPACLAVLTLPALMLKRRRI